MPVTDVTSFAKVTDDGKEFIRRLSGLAKKHSEFSVDNCSILTWDC